ncbi:MAG: MobA/MobL family protein, partial [Gammaproteobacteria bacterium]|nr:MobA/MobL family protein [Gammaproteobacteria bacterium]
MAIYLHAKIIQRSKGKNVVAASAYRRAAKLFDEKEGKSWDYRNKRHVIHTEMIVPHDAPQWVQDLNLLHQSCPAKAAEDLWNKVE